MSDPKDGTYIVTHVDEESAVLEDVHDGQVHAVTSNPGFDPGDVVEATLTPEPPMGVTWTIDVTAHRTISIEIVDDSPGERARTLAAEMSPEEPLARARLDDGELHVLSVPPDRTDDAITDVVEDDATRRRAARLGASSVEVRADAGVLDIRYRRE